MFPNAFTPNPMIDFYRNQINQLQNQQMNQYPMGQQYQPFTVKQVTNVEEAKASIVDPTSTHLFIDTNAGKIYMKRMNNNGLSDFFTFKVEEPVQEKKAVDPLAEINERLTNIENKLGGIYVQSISNDEKSNPGDSKPDVTKNAKSKSAVVSKSSGNDEREE